MELDLSHRFSRHAVCLLPRLFCWFDSHIIPFPVPQSFHPQIYPLYKDDSLRGTSNLCPYHRYLQSLMCKLPFLCSRISCAGHLIRMCISAQLGNPHNSNFLMISLKFLTQKCHIKSMYRTVPKTSIIMFLTVDSSALVCYYGRQPWIKIQIISHCLWRAVCEQVKTSSPQQRPQPIRSRPAKPRDISHQSWGNTTVEQPMNL